MKTATFSLNPDIGHCRIVVASAKRCYTFNNCNISYIMLVAKVDGLQNLPYDSFDLVLWNPAIKSII